MKKRRPTLTEVRPTIIGVSLRSTLTVECLLQLHLLFQSLTMYAPSFSPLLPCPSWPSHCSGITYERELLLLYRMNPSPARRAHLRCLLVGGFLINKKPNPLRLGLGAKRCPTLTGGSPQLPSALESLTSVFGMGTGVASLPSSLHLLFN